ncbi:MAG: cyclopropane-fatty-acyl-phospholipid synthase family protein [Desulfobacterales bacterium]
MTELIIPAKVPALETLEERSIDRVSRRIFLTLMKKIRKGNLTLIEDNRQYSFGEGSPVGGLSAKIRVRHPRFYTKTVFGGTIGAGEAYMAGLWSTDDLTTLIRIVIQNQQVFEEMEKGWARLTEPLNTLYHMLNRNTRIGSRQNIVAHYDLGNDFYALFLDDTMTYSCGIFERDGSTLAEAAVAKYDRICRKLKLEPGDRVVEIGSGWGGFAVHAVLNYGVHVTTTTISDRQYQYAKARFHEAGISDRVRLLKKDYRDLQGRYDKLVSIEMIEAVGHHFLTTFFRNCSRLLEDDGMMALQAITIADQAFDRHKRSADFIKRYIFPGSCIPSVTAIGNAITRGTDLRLVHLEDITTHYSRTLREWRNRFFEKVDTVRTMGFSEPFIRMWEFYLCYCEAGFTERYIGDVQMLFAKPMFRQTIYPN